MRWRRAKKGGTRCGEDRLIEINKKTKKTPQGINSGPADYLRAPLKARASGGEYGQELEQRVEQNRGVQRRERLFFDVSFFPSGDPTSPSLGAGSPEPSC